MSANEEISLDSIVIEAMVDEMLESVNNVTPEDCGCEN